MGKKVLSGLVVLLAAVCCPLACVVSAGASSMFSGYMSEIQNFTAGFEVPSGATAGQAYPLFINIEAGDSDQFLNTVDMYDDLLVGLNVQPAVPLPNSEFDLGERGAVAYVYDKWIPAGESLRLQFNVMASQPGRYLLEIAICMDVALFCPRYEVVLEFE